MKLKTIVENTSKPNTIETLENELKKLDLDYGDTVLVHISQSKIGWTIGGIETIYRAISKVIGPLGTVVVPTQTMDNSDPKDWSEPAVPESWHDDIRNLMPAFDKKTTPSRCMGAFAEYIRVHPYAERSSHPQVSFAALGFHAKKIVKKHPLSPKFGMESPLGIMYKLGEAKILMIGIDISKCTALHLAEAKAEQFHKMETNGCAMIVDNKRKWVTYEDKNYDSDRFSIVENEYLKTHQISEASVGNALAKVYKFNELVDFAEKMFNKL